MGAYIAAIGTTGEPGGGIARILSFVPFFTPLVMPIRMAAGEAPAVEVAAAMAVVVVTIVVVVRLAARVYAGGALRTRGRLKLREALAGGAST